MGRMTYQHDGHWCIDGKKTVSDTQANCWGTAIDLLAAYENTGMEPCDYSTMRAAMEQCKTAKEHLSELIRLVGATGADNLRVMAEAYKDGRLAIFPCRAGGTVYVTDLREGEAIPCEVLCYSAIDGTGEGVIEYKVPAEIPDIVSVEASMEEIGRTIFLTTEEAEKHMKGEG